MSKVLDLSGTPITPEPPPMISRRRRERIQRVQDLWLSGMTTRELSQLYGLSQRAIQKDLADARRLSRETIQNWDSQGTLGREIRFLESTRRSAMRQSQFAAQEAVRLGYLRTALDAASRLVTLLQSVGLLTRVPERIVVEENPFSDPEIRRKFMGVLLEIRRSGEKIPGIDF